MDGMKPFLFRIDLRNAHSQNGESASHCWYHIMATKFRKGTAGPKIAWNVTDSTLKL